MVNRYVIIGFYCFEYIGEDSVLLLDIICVISNYVIK